MYDKTVRRRRAALALLVGFSLVLLTAWFGESSGGVLHSMQRGALQVLAPVQEGASRALKPFRDLAGWVGDTIDAKDERERLEKENRELRRQAIAAAAAVRENRQLRKALRFADSYGLDSYAPVSARVIGRSPTVWYATITVDKGRDAGLREDQPVIDGDGLIGRVSDVSADAAQVTLITDHTSGVSAKVNENGTPGVVRTAVGQPDDLQLDFVSVGSRVSRGQTVVTAGSSSPRLESLFPPDIPIGRVTRVEQGGVDQEVHIKPFANLRELDFVQVLTRRAPPEQQALDP